MKKLFDFSWGDTRGIRKVMCELTTKYGVAMAPQNLAEFGYPAHEGNPELIEEVRKLILDLTGYNYPHIIITNGATNALDAYIHTKRATGSLVTNDLYFSFYKQIAKNNNLTFSPTKNWNGNLSHYMDVGIIDSPSNPLGRLSINGRAYHIVWDAAYFTPTYCGIEKGSTLKCPRVLPLHEAMVGSLNKLTGINGLRVGWLATPWKDIAESAISYLEGNLCGVSAPSQDYCIKILKNVNLNEFYVKSKSVLDHNRTELQRLSYLFGGQPIFPYGMFALFEIDDKLEELFKKANVMFKPGSEIGDTRHSVRINLANSPEDTKAMVDAIIKEDTI